MSGLLKGVGYWFGSGSLLLKLKIKNMFRELIQLAKVMGGRGNKKTAKHRKVETSRYEKHYDAPRSMTSGEREYYKIHKNLTNYKK